MYECAVDGGDEGATLCLTGINSEIVFHFKKI
jgi:hypothetical protein